MSKNYPIYRLHHVAVHKERVYAVADCRQLISRPLAPRYSAESTCSTGCASSWLGTALFITRLVIRIVDSNRRI